MAAITTICISLFGLTYHFIDNRLTILERSFASFREESSNQQVIIADRLATLTANQIIVMNQLVINSNKIDELRNSIYKRVE